jgi:hypothetical protein
VIHCGVGSRLRAIVAFATCAVIAAYLVSRTDEVPEAEPEVATRIVHDETRDAATPVLVEEPSEPTPTSIATHEPTGEIDPCGDAQDDPPITRPSLTELLHLRVAELNDRMRATLRDPHASEDLRRGWEAATDPSRGDEALAAMSHAPDRMQDGFDTYAAVAVVLASNALSSGDPRRAIRIAEAATRAAPSDPLPLLMTAVAHEHLGESAAMRDLFTRAFMLDPEEPAIALAVLQQTSDGPDVTTTLAAYDSYLTAMPDDVAIARRRGRLARRASAIAGGTSTTRAGITILAHRSLPAGTAVHVLDVVDAGLTRGAALLGVPRRDQLTIVVFPDVASMHQATCVQGWAGAVFDGALETDVDTLASPGGDRSLTHESFHAAIHPSVPNVPLWLDEGLAQYVSGEEGPAHVRSYALMVREHTWIPFASMNAAFLDIDDSQDAGLAYHQALAMVEWLVDRRGERGVRDAAAWLSGGGDPTRVLAEAARGELDGETLLAFVARRLAAIQNERQAAPPR